MAYNSDMEESVFTKIIKGELPSYKIYEDEKTFAFLPLHPIAKGHVLVVPKAQVDQFFDLSDGDYQALMAAVQRVARHMKEVLQTKRVGLKVEGLDVPHAHVHVVAFDSAEEYHEQPDESAPPETVLLEQMHAQLQMEESA